MAASSLKQAGAVRPWLRQAWARASIAALLATGAAFLAGRDGQASRQHVNFLVILADDQGWGDLSVHGNTNLSTPHIDSLARDGALFEWFFVSPVCSPTRAEFLTGRYHWRGGVFSTSTGGERLDLDETTIAEIFKQAGYATAIFGKWHNGTQHPYHPNARGFDEFYGFTSGHWGLYFDPPLEHNGHRVRGSGYITDDLTDHAIQFLEQHRDRPFFCYVAYNTPHSPMQVPDRFWNKFAHAELKMRSRNPEWEDIAFTRAALAMVENIDWNVGRLLARLDELGLASNTVVFYFSDNGPNSWRWNGAMKGRKGSVDEGGVRVPGLIRWPGHIPAGKRISQIAAAIDLLPTFAELAGIQLKLRKPLDGISLAPLLLGEPRQWPDRTLFHYWAGRASVRTQRFRLDQEGHLYDMWNDPGQDRDVSAQFPEVTRRLHEQLLEFRKQAEQELATAKDRPFTVGYASTTWLPARDGVPHGGIRRSAQAPNCSYFTHWTSTSDSVTWDIEVGRAGHYEAVIYYTCPAGDTGSVVELSFGDRKARAKILEAHDPPLVGAEYDRVPRKSESYMKDFRPLSLGILDLPQGRGMLVIRAVEIPGKQVGDLQGIELRWQEKGPTAGLALLPWPGPMQLAGAIRFSPRR